MATPLLGRISRWLGGPRVLVLPLVRILAVLSGDVWLALAPVASRGWTPVHWTLLGFLLYSSGVIAALWLRPAAALRRNFLVLLADLGFALALIRFSGGARSTLFLALLVIAGLQACSYGLRRGLLVAAGSAAAYLGLVWPTIQDVEWANMAIRLFVLLGTALGIGILAGVEEQERARVVALSTEAGARDAFIRSVVEGLREGVVALDRDGRVLVWNRALERRCGLAAEHVLGRRLAEVDPGFARAPLAEALTRLLEGAADQFTLDGLEQTTPRGATMTLNVKGNLLRRAGRPAGAIRVIEDVTERVALERSARQADKLAALGTLAAGLAHEVNNPIGVMSSRIELVLLEAESALAPEVAEDLRVVHRHAQRVARIGQGLLSFARRSSGARAPVDLVHLVDETLLLVESPLGKDGIAVVRDLAPVPAILGDAGALQQDILHALPGRDRGAAARAPVQAAPRAPGAADPPGGRHRPRRRRRAGRLGHQPPPAGDDRPERVPGGAVLPDQRDPDRPAPAPGAGR